MAASNQAKLIVWTKAAGLCSFPECRRELVQEPSRDGSVPVGEIAHIVAEQPDGPRGQSPLSLEQRNHPPNLMLLCPTHHTEIDKAPQTYTVERLIEFKRRHEMWVRLQLAKPNLAGKRAMPAPEMLTETVHSTVLPGCRDTRAAPGTTVYVTRTGECYHRSNCRHLRKSKIEYTLEDAIGEGYRPCGTCEPPDSYKIEGER